MISAVVRLNFPSDTHRTKQMSTSFMLWKKMSKSLMGAHAIGCGMTSSLMRKCQHCQKSLFCSRKYVKQCPYVITDHGTSGLLPIPNLLNPVVVSFSYPPTTEATSCSCPYCGTGLDVHMGTCSSCYEKYRDRYCISTCLDMSSVFVPVLRPNPRLLSCLCF
jgi:hypothetical protein